MLYKDEDTLKEMMYIWIFRIYLLQNILLP